MLKFWASVKFYCYDALTAIGTGPDSANIEATKTFFGWMGMAYLPAPIDNNWPIHFISFSPCWWKRQSGQGRSIFTVHLIRRTVTVVLWWLWYLENVMEEAIGVVSSPLKLLKCETRVDRSSISPPNQFCKWNLVEIQVMFCIRNTSLQ